MVTVLDLPKPVPVTLTVALIGPLDGLSFRVDSVVRLASSDSAPSLASTLCMPLALGGIKKVASKQPVPSERTADGHVVNLSPSNVISIFRLERKPCPIIVTSFPTSPDAGDTVILATTVK